MLFFNVNIYFTSRSDFPNPTLNFLYDSNFLILKNHYRFYLESYKKRKKYIKLCLTIYNFLFPISYFQKIFCSTKSHAKNNRATICCPMFDYKKIHLFKKDYSSLLFHSIYFYGTLQYLFVTTYNPLSAV